MRSDCINCKEFQIGLYDLAAANLEQFWETVVSRSKFEVTFERPLQPLTFSPTLTTRKSRPFRKRCLTLETPICIISDDHF